LSNVVTEYEGEWQSEQTTVPDKGRFELSLSISTRPV
jgi:hypothetical protein